MNDNINMPSIVTRTEWGCPDGEDSPQREITINTSITHIIIHHTASSNDANNWEEIVQTIWQYHTVQQQGGDIKYNYLIDEQGTIYHGRAGSVGTVGMHSPNASEGSIGIALIGNFQSGLPTTEAMESLVQLAAYFTQQFHIDPTISSKHEELGHIIPNICGARDVSQTASPGQYLYSALSNVRTRIQTMVHGIPDTTSSKPSGPARVSRTEWGCSDGEDSPGWTPRPITPTHFLVHHTVSTNDIEDFPSHIRNIIWHYHARTKNFKDILYNFLIDSNGIIYDGRAGSRVGEGNIQGGHAYMHNHYSLGIAMIGDFRFVRPTDKAIQSLVDLLVWKTKALHINPLEKNFTPGGTELYTISGHRDVGATACPGAELYDLLPLIRQNVATQL